MKKTFHKSEKGWALGGVGWGEQIELTLAEFFWLHLDIWCGPVDNYLVPILIKWHFQITTEKFHLRRRLMNWGDFVKMWKWVTLCTDQRGGHGKLQSDNRPREYHGGWWKHGGDGGDGSGGEHLWGAPPPRDPLQRDGHAGRRFRQQYFQFLLTLLSLGHS